MGEMFTSSGIDPLLDEIHALKGRIAKLEGLIDGVHLIAANNETGCHSCVLVINAICEEGVK